MLFNLASTLQNSGHHVGRRFSIMSTVTSMKSTTAQIAMRMSRRASVANRNSRASTRVAPLAPDNEESESEEDDEELPMQRNKKMPLFGPDGDTRRGKGFSRAVAGGDEPKRRSSQTEIPSDVKAGNGSYAKCVLRVLVRAGPGLIKEALKTLDKGGVMNMEEFRSMVRRLGEQIGSNLLADWETELIKINEALDETYNKIRSDHGGQLENCITGKEIRKALAKEKKAIDSEKGSMKLKLIGKYLVIG